MCDVDFHRSRISGLSTRREVGTAPHLPGIHQHTHLVMMKALLQSDVQQHEPPRPSYGVIKIDWGRGPLTLLFSLSKANGIPGEASGHAAVRR